MEAANFAFKVLSTSLEVSERPYLLGEEWVKQYLHETPFAYWALTALNHGLWWFRASPSILATAFAALILIFLIPDQFESVALICFLALLAPFFVLLYFLHDYLFKSLIETVIFSVTMYKMVYLDNGKPCEFGAFVPRYLLFYIIDMIYLAVTSIHRLLNNSLISAYCATVKLVLYPLWLVYAASLFFSEAKKKKKGKAKK